MKNKLFAIILIPIAIITIVLCYSYFFVYHITLKGSDIENVQINSEYIDKGVRIKYQNQIITKYETKSNVDTSKIGEYYIEYICGNGIARRVVRVIDNIPPTIELTNGDIEINYNEEFIDPGYVVNDNYDNDLNDKVIVSGNVDTTKLGEYTIKYEISDSNNNKTIKERKVVVKDSEKPNITFKGGLNAYAIKGKKINLNDFTAIDNYDGDITNKVEIKSKVNFNKVNKYEVTYTVSDSNNNIETVKRVINVQEKNTSGIPVLMYHWFYDDTKGEKPGPVNSHNYISKTNIEKQVKYLKDSNFYFPTWKELEDYIDGKIDLPKKSVIITDDDCVGSFFKVAYPVFKKYQVPVTSFCITKKNNWQKYLGKEYLDFQSHTDSLHDRICNTYWDGAVMCSSYDKIYNDIKKSISKINNNDAFAYPFGHYSDDTIKALKNNGIKLAFTIQEGRVRKGLNKYKLPRVRMSAGTTLEQFKRAVN